MTSWTKFSLGSSKPPRSRFPLGEGSASAPHSVILHEPANYLHSHRREQREAQRLFSRRVYSKSSQTSFHCLFGHTPQKELLFDLGSRRFAEGLRILSRMKQLIREIPKGQRFADLSTFEGRPGPGLAITQWMKLSDGYLSGFEYECNGDIGSANSPKPV